MTLPELLSLARDEIFSLAKNLQPQVEQEFYFLGPSEIIFSGDEYFLEELNRWVPVLGSVGLRPSDFPRKIILRRRVKKSDGKF